MLIIASGAAHVWQWRESHRKDALLLERFMEEQRNNKAFHVDLVIAQELAKQERAELLAVVETLKASTTQGSRLLKELGEDFELKSENYIMDIAKREAGTPNEAYGKEVAMWHAQRLEACGLSSFGMTAKQLVEGHFKIARERK